MTDLKQTLSDIAKAIVDNPDEVTVILSEDERSITLSLNVAPEDMGMVIGKNGKIAKFGTVEEVITKDTLSDIYRVDFEIQTIHGRPLTIYY